MPKKFKANLAIANEIFFDLRPQIVSSHTIIDRSKLPFLLPPLFKHYEKEFGSFVFNQFLRYQTKMNVIRAAVYAAAASYVVAPNATAGMAATYFGIGECQEIASRIALELLKRKCTDFSLMVLNGDLPEYGHALIVIGGDGSTMLGKPITDFKDFDKNAVYLDLFLGRVGRAIDLNADLQAYMDAYKLNQVTGVTQYAAEHVSLAKQLEKNARAIHAKVALEVKQQKFTFDLSWNGPYYAYHLAHSQTQGDPTLLFFTTPTTSVTEENESFFKPRSILIDTNKTSNYDFDYLDTAAVTDNHFIPKRKA